jgi:origin recognition complex subunit 3
VLCLPVKRKPVTSLSNYDIELLKVWHGVLRDATGRSYVCPWSGYGVDISEGEPPPQLVVFLHEFEQFEEAVVQDLFYICRQARIFLIDDAAQRCLSSYVPQLPLIFVLALSSPHNSFLNAVYPQSVLSLLRVDTFTVPSGTGFLEELVTKVSKTHPSNLFNTPQITPHSRHSSILISNRILWLAPRPWIS